MYLTGAHDGSDRSEPSADQLRAMHRRIGPPENELPGAIPFHAVLSRNDDLAIALVGAQAFSTGILLKISVRLRRADTVRLTEALRRPLSGDALLLLGVIYPDGRTASNVPEPGFDRRFSPDDRPTLFRQGGSGGGRTFDMDYWLTPLPTDGDMTIIVAWPSRGITEERVVIPAAAMKQGLSANIELWPWQGPEHDEEPPMPAMPELPEGSWFAQHRSDDLPRS